MIRALILLLLLSGLGWGLFHEQGRGRFQQVDETFVDFLLANARAGMKPDASKLGEVVFVRLREEDKKEYETWPPSPSDYQMIVKGLSAFDPAVLVFADPLNWPEPKPASIPLLAQALVPIPSVVLAAEVAESGKADEASVAYAKEYLPSLATLTGQPELLPEIPSFTRLPEPPFRQSDTGIVTPKGLSFVLRESKRAVPSLALAALSRATRTPYASQHLRTGPGAGIHLGTNWFVPLEKDGSLKPVALPVPSVNGLELMTSNLVDADAAVTKILGKGKTIVVGMDNDSATPTSARTQVHAIAGALTLPKVHELGFMGQIIAWVLAGLGGLSLLLLPKQKATLRTLGLLFAVLLVSYIAFEISLVWCPPTMLVGLIVVAGVFVRLFGFDPNRPKKKKSGSFYKLQ